MLFVRLSAVFLASILSLTHAQSPPIFQPPRPPMDQEFEDPSEDDLELNDQPNRAPPPPLPAPPPPMTDFRPVMPNSSKLEPGKLKFQLVEGTFYEKGKPRGRAPVNKR